MSYTLLSTEGTDNNLNASGKTFCNAGRWQMGVHWASSCFVGESPRGSISIYIRYAGAGILE
ncbi:hypothetical protein [Hymenobacter sediminis]|uniref:hypothetical protein n=1 Tax=Hymenobacter sediminis TaxID=2218621 RepID=UPI001EE49789|nr:hypothetical protein [Hymenobacter sediminis]